MYSRIIPCLLLERGNLVKTQKFSASKYVGDPINAVKIFNEKEADEILVLDISEEVASTGPNFDLIESLASECFMPLAYGGGMRNLDQAFELTRIGVEKIVLNTSLHANPRFVREAVEKLGSQAIIGSIDVKRDLFRRQRVFIRGGKKNTRIDPISYCDSIDQLGVGEILITSIDHEGCGAGYDFSLVREISTNVSVPVIANGGASSLEDMTRAINVCGASAAAAGSLFVFYGEHRAVLISYPNFSEIERAMR